ncbi:hypothetical protein HK101_007226, partial [Irineochytrium annulatum]
MATGKSPATHKLRTPRSSRRSSAHDIKVLASSPQVNMTSSLVESRSRSKSDIPTIADHRRSKPNLQAARSNSTVAVVASTVDSQIPSLPSIVKTKPTTAKIDLGA